MFFFYETYSTNAGPNFRKSGIRFEVFVNYWKRYLGMVRFRYKQDLINRLDQKNILFRWKENPMSKKYAGLAHDIVEKLGGKENITEGYHC